MADTHHTQPAAAVMADELYKRYCLLYFQHTRNATWDVVGYLRHCSNLRPLDFNLTIGFWHSHLRKVAKSPDPVAALRAQTLIKLYSEKGRQSDASRAKQFVIKRREKQKKKDHPAGAVNIQAVGDNYGTLILGHGNQVDSSLAPPGPEIPEARPINADTASPPFSNVLSYDSFSVNSSVHGDREATPSDYGDGIEDPNQLPHPVDDSLEYNPHGNLEQILSDYGRRITKPDLSHHSIIDSSDKGLISLFHRSGFPLAQLKEYYRMPFFPKCLQTHLSLYGKVSTVLECKQVSLASESDWPSPPTNSDLLFCKRWIDRAAETVMSLITDSHGLLQQNLGEGVWEGIYWNLLDVAFTNHPSLMLQRRDTSLYALEQDPEPITNASSRFDGIIRTREPSTLHTHRLEFGVVEVSRKFEKSDSLKWNSDMGKLHAACRSMLGILKTAVGDDQSAIEKLAVVGILQAGRVTLVLVMSCIGENLYFLRRGSTWLLPLHLHEFGNLSSLIVAIWKAREIIRVTYEVVIDSLRSHQRKSPQLDSDPEFL